MVSSFLPFSHFFSSDWPSGILLDRLDRGQHSVPFEVLRGQDRWLLRLALPGLERESLAVSLQGKTLSVRAQREALERDARPLSRGIPRGAVELDLSLGFEPDPDGVCASYASGILEIELGRPRKDLPHKIEVTQRKSESQG